MLTQAQRNAVFTNIPTAHTIDAHAYTATVTYPAHWSGEIDTPIILINYLWDASQKQDTIGGVAEWDTARFTVDVFAKIDTTNSVHGIKIAREIARTLVLWFKQTADGVLNPNGLKITKTYPVRDLSHLEEKVYRMHFEVDGLLYLLFCWTFIPAIIAFIEAIRWLCMSNKSFAVRYQ
jgi:hypothetical protein